MQAVGIANFLYCTHEKAIYVNGICENVMTVMVLIIIIEI